MSESQSAAAAPPSGPRNSNTGGRRRGGRGGSHPNSERPETNTEDGRSDGQSRGSRSHGGRGRGGRGGRDGQQQHRSNNPKPRARATSGTNGEDWPPPGTGPDRTGTSGDRPTGDAIATEGEGDGKAKQLVAPATDEPDDGEVCFICASKVEHTSVAPCNHRTCHICALRLRALYKTKACAHCRVCSKRLHSFIFSPPI
jgi:hypothetical protein